MVRTSLYIETTQRHKRYSIRWYCFSHSFLVFLSRHTDRVDGIPSLGWSTTIAYLILPCLLVVSQFASMQLMQPKPVEGAEPPQGQAILKFLPLMIGWFSLNVPSALCIYWITNNIVTTASSVFIRNNVAAAEAMGPSTTTSAPAETSSASKSVFAPPREKPSGFGASASASTSSDGVKPITSIDAEIEDLEYDDDDEEDSPTSAEPVKKKRGKKGKKAKN
jgi:YidC/Oxa1 family membrane protein insertase